MQASSLRDGECFLPNYLEPHGSTSDGANIRRAVLEDEKKVIEFLDFQHRQKIFGFRFQDGEWERRKRTWPGFSIENFMIAETAAGKIIGCCAPWTASDVKANIIEKYPFVFRLMTLFKNIPRFGEKLKTTYLTHLEIDSTLNGPSTAADLSAPFRPNIRIDVGRPRLAHDFILRFRLFTVTRGLKGTLYFSDRADGPLQCICERIDARAAPSG